MMSPKWLGLIALSMLSFSAHAQKRPMMFEDLWSAKHIKDLALSPDGERLAFTLSQSDSKHGKPKNDIYLISTRGGIAVQLTTHSAYDGKPCWSPDGNIIAFLSERSGSRQIHLINPEGGEAHQFTWLDEAVEDFKWTPDGRHFVMAIRTFPDSIAETQFKRRIKPSGSSARIINRLLYRHWRQWDDGKTTHLWVTDREGLRLWDVTPGLWDAPTTRLGSCCDYSISPDGRTLAFVRNTDSLKAFSTNNDIFTVPVKGGKIRRISASPANDNQPIFSPNGRYLAWCSMRRPGFESDQYDIMLRDFVAGRTKNMTSLFDLDIKEMHWGPSSRKLYFTARDVGRQVIYALDIENGKIRGLVHQGVNQNLNITPDGERLFFMRSRVHQPWEIFRASQSGDDIMQHSFLNHTLTESIEMNLLEDFWFPSFDSKVVQGMLVKPPFFDPAKQYPAIVLIHGGPQGAWEDRFHPRWNASLFAARGYCVLLFNIRGSKGFGQDFCDAVSRQWGGAAYKDLMTGLDYALTQFPFIDSDRLAAAGGSYGGYMVNWLATQSDRFCCLVSHAGIFDLKSFYGVTEELWFPEWEFGGSPYDNGRLYEKWSPSNRARHFKTPMLVVHGAQDFRVPVDQGLALFTALQKQHVPSRLLYYPDEGHFITGKENARLWWKTIGDWIDQWTAKTATD